MGEYLKKVLPEIRTYLAKMPKGRKFMFIFATFAILGGISWLVFWIGNTTYVPLMSNLNPEDSTNIIRILREKRIPFKLDASGKTISILPDNLYDLRLGLATMGLPQSSVVGYEILDKQTVGTTTFMQKVNQKRAQEGELMRTINTIRGVRRSRVHLAIPQKSTFVEDQKRATASVVVDLEPHIVLTEKQVFGITNLVAHAIEGLDSTDVVVMNSDGKILSKNSSDPLSAATATQLDFQGKVESELEKRIESVLSRVIGDGHVVAKVTADLDFSQVNETQTTYDQDGSAVRSVEKHVDSMNGTRPGPYGVAGSASNQPGQPPASNGEVRTETSKNNEVTNYEVPQIIRKTTRSQGSIKRLSVAVVVDGKITKTPDKDGKIVSKVDSWPPQKIKEFEDLAISAVGLDKKRGDTFEIKSMEFAKVDLDEAERIVAETQQKNYVESIVIYSVLALVVSLFFMFVVRPFIKWMTESTIDNIDTFLPQTIEELEKLQKNVNLPTIEETVPELPEILDPTKVEGEMIKEKIISLVDANPHKAALILKDWLGDVRSGKANVAKTEAPKNGKAASV